MKSLVVPFLVGGGIVYAANWGATKLTTPGSDGKSLVKGENGALAAAAVGGLALVLAHKFIGSAA